MGVATGKRLAARVRRGCPPADEAVVEGAPDLTPTDEARARVAQAFVDLYVDIVLDALVRRQRGASAIEAVRQALAQAETPKARS